MKKFLTGLFLMTVLITAAAFAQATAYQFVKNFPDDNFKGGSGAHGIAVDPAGKVWIQLFGATDSILDASTGKYRTTRVIHAFNPDGTPASFSPIKTVAVAGKTDTLYNSNRGMGADHQGNILFASFDALYRVNYKTGAGMNKILPQANQTLTAPAVTQDGDIVVGKVLDGVGPIQLLDKDFNLIGNVVDTARGFARTIAVSKDGKDVYHCPFTLGSVIRYHSDNGTLGPYSKIDTLLKGMKVESAAWHPKTGYLWVSAGSNNDKPTGYSPFTWYAYDVANNKVVDSLKWTGATTSDPRPRAIAFSPTGDTVYVGQFNVSTLPAVQVFRRVVVSVEKETNTVPTGYELSQNFPNPFNPSTKIKFTVAQSGMTTLKVYDVMGREIATLVNEILGAGAYSSTFDARNLPTGTYIYVLTSGGHRLTNKMVLLK